MDIQYVTDNEGNRIAVLIPIGQWESIKAELDDIEATEDRIDVEEAEKALALNEEPIPLGEIKRKYGLE